MGRRVLCSSAGGSGGGERGSCGEIRRRCTRSGGGARDLTVGVRKTEQGRKETGRVLCLVHPVCTTRGRAAVVTEETLNLALIPCWNQNCWSIPMGQKANITFTGLAICKEYPKLIYICNIFQENRTYGFIALDSLINFESCCLNFEDHSFKANKMIPARTCLFSY